jgi:hypothetical protein
MWIKVEISVISTFIVVRYVKLELNYSNCSSALDVSESP